MSKIFNIRPLVITTLLSLPLIVSAAITGNEATQGFTTLGGLVSTFTKSIVGALAVLCLTLGVVAFFWGIVQYIWGLRAGDATKEKNGRNFMLWGLIALFVMFSVWGIVRYAQRIFGIEGKTVIMIPDIRFEGGSGGGKRTDVDGLPTPNTPATSGVGTQCYQKPYGSSCTVAGRAGLCENSETDIYGCYVTPGAPSCAPGSAWNGSSCVGVPAPTPTPAGNDLTAPPSAGCPNGQNADGDCIVNGAECVNGSGEKGWWHNGKCGVMVIN